MTATSPLYVLDSNVLIEAAKRYYGFDIAPSFWDRLVEYVEQGVIISIDRVKDEIEKGKDDLTDWCNTRFRSAFRSTQEPAALDAYRAIMHWAQKQTKYTDKAKRKLAEADNADAWIVAYAKVHGCIVVTHERYDPKVERRIPIPNICQAFSVSYCDTFELMRRIGIKL